MSLASLRSLSYSYQTVLLNSLDLLSNFLIPCVCPGQWLSVAASWDVTDISWNMDREVFFAKCRAVSAVSIEQAALLVFSLKQTPQSIKSWPQEVASNVLKSVDKKRSSH